MSFCYFSKDYSDNTYTAVENRFILKYMPHADSVAVKVYLYGLCLCQTPDRDFSLSHCAEALGMTEKDIKECFRFWEDCDLIQILCEDPFTVEYLPVRSASGRPKKVRYEKYADFNKELQRKMQTAGVFLDYATMQKYMNFLQTNDMEPPAFLLIVEYCIQRTDSPVSHAQIFNKAKNLIKRGLVTYSQVEQALSDFNVHTADLKRVLAALSITREPNEEDYALFSKWIAAGLTPAAIRECARTSKLRSMKTLDMTIDELLDNGKTERDDIVEYLSEKEALTQLTFRVARSLGVKISSPGVFNDEYTGKWFNRGYEEKSLVALALFCVKTERNSFPRLDELLDQLYADGIVSEESVQGFLTEANANVKLLSKLHKYCVGIRPSQSNLETVATWKKWNFSEEMIVEAAKKATATAHPIPYMNKILSDWKRSNIFSPADIPKDAPSPALLQKKDPRTAVVQAANDRAEREKFYSALRNRAQALADRNNERAMQNPEYREIAALLSDAVREAAKAEVFHPENLASVQAKVSSLKAQRLTLLSDMGITEEDLSPRYRCPKCSDTGFLPDGRACDCYQK